MGNTQDALRVALKACKFKFKQYVDYHASNNSVAKEVENQIMVDMINAALSATPASEQKPKDLKTLPLEREANIHWMRQNVSGTVRNIAEDYSALALLAQRLVELYAWDNLHKMQTEAMESGDRLHNVQQRFGLVPASAQQPMTDEQISELWGRYASNSDWMMKRIVREFSRALLAQQAADSSDLDLTPEHWEQMYYAQCRLTDELGAKIEAGSDKTLLARIDELEDQLAEMNRRYAESECLVASLEDQLDKRDNE